jgi:hypothetical protein
LVIVACREKKHDIELNQKENNFPHLFY